jgi:hypothetical protein
MAEIVTPNEIAKGLGVTGPRFRNWLREQKALSRRTSTASCHVAGWPSTRLRDARTHGDSPYRV